MDHLSPRGGEVLPSGGQEALRGPVHLGDVFLCDLQGPDSGFQRSGLPPTPLASGAAGGMRQQGPGVGGRGLTEKRRAMLRSPHFFLSVTLLYCANLWLLITEKRRPNPHQI